MILVVQGRDQLLEKTEVVGGELLPYLLPDSEQDYDEDLSFPLRQGLEPLRCRIFHYIIIHRSGRRVKLLCRHTRVWDVVSAVRNGQARFEWDEVVSEADGNRLYVSVMRDAIRFDGVPAMNWHRDSVPGDGRTFDGVRVPATAAEMQEIADMLFCMLPTPRVLDLVWAQAKLRFDPVVNLGAGKIVATQNVNDVHEAVEKRIAAAGGYPERGIVASVGKYWVVCNSLEAPSPDSRPYGIRTACNYGWHSSSGAYAGVTPGVKVWQGIGTRHNDEHVDPSQVIRLMYRMARLVRADGSEDRVDLHEVAKDNVLSAALNHKAGGSTVLKVLRQPSVKEPETVTEPDGSIVVPETVVYGGSPPSEMSELELSEFLASKG